MLQWIRNHVPETLNLIATIAAAVAAAFAAIAAFGQEHAMFSSVLYGKQIELVGNFYEAGITLARDLNMLASFTVAMGDTSALNQEIDQAREHLTQLRRAASSTDLVVPKGYDALVQSVTFIARHEVERWDVVRQKGLPIAPGPKQVPLSPLTADDYKLIDYIGAELLSLQKCAYDQFKEVRVLSEAEVSECEIAVPPHVHL